MRNLEYYPVEGANSLWHWPKFVHKVIKIFDYQIPLQPLLRLRSCCLVVSSFEVKYFLGLMVMCIFFLRGSKYENIVGYTPPFSVMNVSAMSTGLGMWLWG